MHQPDSSFFGTSRLNIFLLSRKNLKEIQGPRYDDKMTIPFRIVNIWIFRRAIHTHVMYIFVHVEGKIWGSYRRVRARVFTLGLSSADWHRRVVASDLSSEHLSNVAAGDFRTS